MTKQFASRPSQRVAEQTHSFFFSAAARRWTLSVFENREQFFGAEFQKPIPDFRILCWPLESEFLNVMADMPAGGFHTLAAAPRRAAATTPQFSA
jgi:hypothetical protein